jgi:TP53 regulating kinase-like protein
MVDAVEGVIGIEWIEGKSVRHLLPGCAEEGIDETEDNREEEEVDPLSDYGVSQG